MTKNIGLVPLRNFGVVDPENKIYRSAQPMYAYEYRWIKNVLGVETIVNLRAESRHDDRMNTMGFEVVNINVKDHNPPSKRQAMEFINLVKSKKGKIFFHCEHGHGRTSTFCVLAKIAMGSDLDTALAEEKDVFNYEFRHPKQKEFLENNFKIHLVVS